MNDSITQKWKDETMLQAKALADREWKNRLIRHMDRYVRAFNNADALISKEAENDVLNLIDNLRSESASNATREIIEKKVSSIHPLVEMLLDWNPPPKEDKKEMEKLYYNAILKVISSEFSSHLKDKR